MAKRKESNYLLWAGVLAAVAVLVGAFKYIMNSIKSGIAINTAPAQGAAYAAQNAQVTQQGTNGSQVRTPKIKSTADTINEEYNAFNQDETKMVRVMNELMNAAEAGACSAYYASAYGRSLKADLESALDGALSTDGILGGVLLGPLSAVLPSGSRFTDIKEVIRKNLY